MAVCSTESITVESLSYEKDFFDLPAQESCEEEFFNLLYSRRAIRNFSDKKVTKEVLEKIVKAISLAPPGFLLLRPSLSLFKIST